MSRQLRCLATLLASLASSLASSLPRSPASLASSLPRSPALGPWLKHTPKLLLLSQRPGARGPGSKTPQWLALLYSSSKTPQWLALLWGGLVHTPHSVLHNIVLPMLDTSKEHRYQRMLAHLLARPRWLRRSEQSFVSHKHFTSILHTFTSILHAFTSILQAFHKPFTCI